METKDYDAAMAVVDEALFPTPFRDELRATAQRLSSGGKGILAVRSLTLPSTRIPSLSLSVTLRAPPILTPALPRTRIRTSTPMSMPTPTLIPLKRLTSPPLP